MLPLWPKILFTSFVAVVMPVYAVRYGLRNFLWFSDIALLVGCAAMWLESPLLASMQAVSVTILELVWIVDFFARLASGRSPFGLAAYMFDSKLPVWLRGLSLFHLWMPPLLLWLVANLGYDRRAWPAQTIVAWIVLPVSRLVSEPRENINWVFGPGEKPQEWMTPTRWLALLMIVFPFCLYLPTHLVLEALFGHG
jgi:hypothetical protein